MYSIYKLRYSNLIYLCLALFLLFLTGCSDEAESVNSNIAPSNLNISDDTSDLNIAPASDISKFTYNTSRDFILPSYGANAPTKGESRYDPTTGVKITRLTDADELNNTADALIVYSRYSPENSDGTLFLAFGANSTSSWVIDRLSGGIITELKRDSTNQIGEVHEVRWDMSGNYPYRIYFRNGMSFYQIDDVRDQASTRTLLKDFSSLSPASSKLYNDVEGDSSNDSDHWAWMAAHYDGTTFIVDSFIHYQISTNTTHILRPSDLAGSPLNAYSIDSTFPRPNMIEVSPLGTGIVLHYGRSWGDSSYGNRPDDIGTWFDGPHLWPLDFDFTTSAPVKISIDETHSGWSFDENGNELFISQNNRTDKLDAVKVTGNNLGYDNRIEITEHSDFGWSNGFHYGKMPTSKKGWAFVNTYSNISHANHLADWAADQLILIQTKPKNQNPIILRIGSNYNMYAGNYRDEAPAALNMSGSRIYVSSNWGGNLGHREVFLFELPDEWNNLIKN